MARRRVGVPWRGDQRSWLEGEAPLSELGRTFLAYWRGKRPPGGGFPGRADIAPEEMLHLLPYIFMVDVLRGAEGEPDFRFRLVGTAIAEMEGEHTGRLLSDMFVDRDAYAVLWQQYRDAAAGKVWVRRETLRWRGLDHVSYEVILAPLQDGSGVVTMLIGLAHAPDG